MKPVSLAWRGALVAVLVLTVGNGWAISQGLPGTGSSNVQPSGTALSQPAQGSLPQTTNRESPQTQQSPRTVDPASVKESVREAFEARQTQLRQELAEFQARIDRLSRVLDERERLKTEIIDHRVNELLNPNLKWETTDGSSSDKANVTLTYPTSPGKRATTSGPELPRTGSRSQTTTTPRSDSSYSPPANLPSASNQMSRPRTDSGLNRFPQSKRLASDDAEWRGDRFEVKIFKLQHARAAEIARTLQALVSNETISLRASADAASNSLIVFAKPADLEIVEALIIRLDVRPETTPASGGGPPPQAGDGGSPKFNPFDAGLPAATKQ